MALALVGTPAGAAAGAGGAGLTSLTSSLTLDAAATMLVAHIGLVHGGSTRTVSSVTYAGASLTQVSGAGRTNTAPYGDPTSDLWYLASPATGANNLVTTPSAGCAAICHGVSGWSGDDGTVTGGDGATGSADPATKSVSTTSGQVVVGVICAYAGYPGAGANITSNNTLLFEVENHSQEDDVTNAAYDAGSSPTMSWENDAGDGWAISVALLSPAGGGSSSIDVPDSGAGSDAPTVAAAVPVADTGSGSDAPSIAAAVPVADSGAGSDAPTVEAGVPPADTGSGSDAPSITAAVPVADAGAGSDVPSVAASVSVADIGAGVDAIGVLVSVDVGDAGSGSEVSVPEVGGVPGDTGSGVDSVGISAAVPIADSGLGIDGVTVPEGGVAVLVRPFRAVRVAVGVLGATRVAPRIQASRIPT